MKNAILFYCMLISICTNAQSLEVVYDAQSGNLSYFQEGVEIDDPKVKRGQKIILKVNNYNNYLYELDIKEVQQEKRISDGGNPLGNLQGVGFNQFGSLMSPIIEVSDFDADGVIDRIDLEPEIVNFESAQEQAIYQLKNNASAKMESINSIKYQFKETNAQVEDYQRQGEFKAIALKEVKKLKYNPNIATNKIKKTSKSILENVLDIQGKLSPTLTDVIENNREEKELKQLLSNQEDRKKRYLQEVNTLKRYQDELVELAPNRPDLLSMYVEMEGKITEAPDVISNSDLTSSAINDLIIKEKNKSLTELMDIWYEYEAITSNDFSTTYLSRAESDQVVLNMAFQLKESVPDSLGAQKLIQLAPVKIPVYGRLKINASVGFSFGQFFNRPKSYFVRDSVILGQNGDSFIPMVTSFVHFYRQSKGIVSLGGSMGVGIPINGSGLESTSFFIGPSVFFGQSERFVLNTGLMGSKINRLTLGYKEGDFYSGDENLVPVEGLYEIGFFLGLSFNLRK